MICRGLDLDNVCLLDLGCGDGYEGGVEVEGLGWERGRWWRDGIWI